MATGTRSLFSLRAGLALCSVSLLTLTGCASASPDADATATITSSEEEALPTPIDAYVTVARDDRDCRGSRCGGGGYWIRRVNVCAPPVYVSRLDLSPLGWSGELAAKVLTAPSQDLVLRGHVGRGTGTFGATTFLVSEAYRGMPGVRAGDEDVFYSVQPRALASRCFPSPCRPWTAQPLNEPTSAAASFNALDVDAAAKTLVDPAWLAREVEGRGAVVSARFVAGLFSRLDVSQVFVRLPDLVGPCPMLPMPACAEGEVLASTRTVDRCMVPGACVTKGICFSSVLHCAPGYTLTSWPAAPNGCPEYACDPAF